jgi:hypothetical protein
MRSFARFEQLYWDKFKVIQNQYQLFRIKSENQEHVNQFH